MPNNEIFVDIPDAHYMLRMFLSEQDTLNRKEILALRLVSKKVKAFIDKVYFSDYPFIQICLQFDTLPFKEIIQSLDKLNLTRIGERGTQSYPKQPLITLYGIAQNTQDPEKQKLISHVAAYIIPKIDAIGRETAWWKVRHGMTLNVQKIWATRCYTNHADEMEAQELLVITRADQTLAREIYKNHRDKLNKDWIVEHIHYSGSVLAQEVYNNHKECLKVNELLRIVRANPTLAQEIYQDNKDKLSGDDVVQIVKRDPTLAREIYQDNKDKLSGDDVVEIVKRDPTLAREIYQDNKDKLSGDDVVAIVTNPILALEIYQDRKNNPGYYKLKSIKITSKVVTVTCKRYGVSGDDVVIIAHPCPDKTLLKAIFQGYLSTEMLMLEIVRVDPTLVTDIYNNHIDKLYGHDLARLAEIDPTLVTDIYNNHIDKLDRHNLVRLAEIDPTLVPDIYKNHIGKLGGNDLARLAKIDSTLVPDIYKNHIDKFGGYSLAELAKAAPTLAQDIYKNHTNKLNTYQLTDIACAKPELAKDIFADHKNKFTIADHKNKFTISELVKIAFCAESEVKQSIIDYLIEQHKQDEYDASGSPRLFLGEYIELARIIETYYQDIIGDDCVT